MSSTPPARTMNGHWKPLRPEWVGMPYGEIGYFARDMVGGRPELMQAAGMLVKAANEGHTSWWFGNGGSAAQADHLAAELVGRYRLDRAPLAAVSLCGSAAAMTAIANDYGYEHVYGRQLAGCGRAGDVAIGLSTSGKSENVLMGLRIAGVNGMGTILLTGAVDMATLPRYPAEVVIPCPGLGTSWAIQEQHLAIGHLLCGVVEQLLFGKRG